MMPPRGGVFAAAWPDSRIVQEVLAQIPWYHQIALLEKLNQSAERLWYARQAIENGWSHSVLELQIEKNTYRRQGKALNNFKNTLPPADSDMAAQIFKDPYLFDFTETADPRREREIEIVKSLPKKLSGILPTVEEIEAELNEESS